MWRMSLRADSDAEAGRREAVLEVRRLLAGRPECEPLARRLEEELGGRPPGGEVEPTR
jgi:hypothetical protein